MPTVTIEGFPILQAGKWVSSDLEHLRIGAMLGILFISLFAVSFPSVSKQIPSLKIPHLVFFIGKHFGTGAILSTAFCHLLPDAFDSLKDRDVNKRYHGIGKWTGMIILGSLLLIFLVEYVSTSYVDLLHSKPSAPSSLFSSPAPSRSKTPSIDTLPPMPQAALTSGALHSQSQESSFQGFAPCASPSCTRAATEHTPLLRAPKRTKSLSNVDLHRDHTLLSLVLLNAPRLSRGGLPHSGLVWGRDMACVCPLGRVSLGQTSEGHHAVYEEDDNEGRGEAVKPKIGRQRQVVGILVLQLGIMIHSLVIGLTLAISSGSDFTSLVTAIIFHQLFEGLSLGIRIASLPPSHPPPRTLSRNPSLTSTDSNPSLHLNPDSKRWSQKWLGPTLSVLFAITTPLGMILGIVLFTPSKATTSPAESARLHLTQGLMSGISAGMLIYASTVEMLAGDFVFGDVSGNHGHNHSHGSLEHEHGHAEPQLSVVSRKVLAVLSLLAGSIAMALVGMGE